MIFQKSVGVIYMKIRFATIPFSPQTIQEIFEIWPMFKSSILKALKYLSSEKEIILYYDYLSDNFSFFVPEKNWELFIREDGIYKINSFEEFIPKNKN